MRDSGCGIQAPRNKMRDTGCRWDLRNSMRDAICGSRHISRTSYAYLVSPYLRISYRLSRLFPRCLLLCAPSFAHEARPAYLEIKETAPGKFSVLWRTPVLAGMRLPLVLKMPDDVKNLKAPAVQELADSLVERRSIDAGPNGLAGKRIEFVGLQLTITDVLVRLEMLDGRKWTTIARPSQPWVEVAASQSWWEVMGTYIVEGIRHILFGADHMLFVLGLLLIVKNRWMLLKTVTAFTVAHSITLAIATLGYAEAPVLPLNAAIALSILFLGPEIVKQNDARSGIRDTGYGIRDSRYARSRIPISHLESRIP